MNAPADCNLLIIGSGASGLAAAVTAAHHALKVVLVEKDPVFGGISIPKYFWKILITKRSNNLAAAAFIISQRNLVMEIDRIHEAEIFEKLTAAQAHVFQVPIASLAKLTRLDFGNLGQVDTHEATAVGPRLIESYDDIRI